MFERWRDPWKGVCFDGDAGGVGRGDDDDTEGPDESNAFGTDPSADNTGNVGTEMDSDIGDAIGAAEAAAMAASVSQNEENAFGGMGPGPDPGFGFVDPITGNFVSAQEMATKGAFSALTSALGAPMAFGPLGLAHAAMQALGATPGTDVDTFGAPIGEVGTTGEHEGGAQGVSGGAENYEPETYEPESYILPPQPPGQTILPPQQTPGILQPPQVANPFGAPTPYPSIDPRLAAQFRRRRWR